MNFQYFVQQYVQPSRWWRRARTIELTIWPRFLAQALCPHLLKQTIMWDVVGKSKTSMCLDCRKHINETNDCAHGEVTVFASTQDAKTQQPIPVTFQCTKCGVELKYTDMPRGVVVRDLQVGNAAQQSAARDH